MLPPCGHCDAALQGCLEQAFWQVDIDRCHARRRLCDDSWVCNRTKRDPHLSAPLPDRGWAATIRRGR
jgi:hypothetical protein